MAQSPNVLTQSDVDAQETREWLDALDGVLANEGPERAQFLIEQQIAVARESGVDLATGGATAYLNSIPVDR